MQLKLEHLSEPTPLENYQKDELEILNTSQSDLAKLEIASKDSKIIDATNEQGKSVKMEMGCMECYGGCKGTCLSSCSGACEGTCSGSCSGSLH